MAVLWLDVLPITLKVTLSALTHIVIVDPKTFDAHTTGVRVLVCPLKPYHVLQFIMSIPRCEVHFPFVIVLFLTSSLHPPSPMMHASILLQLYLHLYSHS